MCVCVSVSFLYLSYLISDCLFFVDSQSAESWEQTRGNVGGGAVTVRGGYCSNCSTPCRREWILEWSEKCRDQHFLPSLSVCVCCNSVRWRDWYMYVHTTHCRVQVRGNSTETYGSVGPYSRLGNETHTVHTIPQSVGMYVWTCSSI